MISSKQAGQFAASWIAAWNAHDLDRILQHYTDDFEMRSPKIAFFVGEPSGKLRGKAAVGAYWKRALELRPDLHFRLLEVCVGVDSVCLRYESLDGKPAVEWFEFNDAFQIRRAAAHYGDAPLK
ncbi:MAG: nuclear transport factor 2 family protein [Limisphaerales bacterium]